MKYFIFSGFWNETLLDGVVIERPTRVEEVADSINGKDLKNKIIVMTALLGNLGFRFSRTEQKIIHMS